ncbi:MAG: DUF6660 family protein [Bacteroidota bacterium]
MKYFWSIFSIYIFILSTVPCGDGRECNETECTQETACNDSACAGETASGETEKDCRDETCSPFCGCVCCGSVVSNINSFSSTTAFNQTIEKNSFSYKSQFISQFTANIWQPPKLS